jgi:hypothetical protein
VLRTVVGSSLYLTVVVVIGLALGALLRRTAAGLSVFAAVFFVVPIVVGARHGYRKASRSSWIRQIPEAAFGTHRVFRSGPRTVRQAPG